MNKNSPSAMAEKNNGMTCGKCWLTEEESNNWQYCKSIKIFYKLYDCFNKKEYKYYLVDIQLLGRKTTLSVCACVCACACECACLCVCVMGNIILNPCCEFIYCDVGRNGIVPTLVNNELDISEPETVTLMFW